jgi:hypothetical protein
MRATCPSHFPSFDCPNNKILWRRVCEPRSSSLRSFRQTPLTSKYSLEHPEIWDTSDLLAGFEARI